MIEQLRKFYDTTGEIVVPYDRGQEELYEKAMKELVQKAEFLEQHSYEIRKLRDEIQRKYDQLGLRVDLYSCCKNPNWHNFAAMFVKRFLSDRGFRVLTSSEDFALIFDRGTRYDTEGFSTICKIFGERRVNELMRKAQRNGGEPDLFVYLNQDPSSAWFVEAKRRTESLTSAQIENFPFITDLLCPIEIARIVPSNTRTSSVSAEGSENRTRASMPCIFETPVTSRKHPKPIWYAVNGSKGAELPTLFERCIKSLRERGTAKVVLRDGIDAEEVIFRFRYHPGYQRFIARCKPTPQELEDIFATVRSGKIVEDIL
jgi:hypothetical protein